MKDSTQDELKSLFDNAFQAEQIPFDPGAWDQMNDMLNKRQRRKVLGFWFSSGALFLAASASILLLFGSTPPVYAPRTAEASFTSLDMPAWQTDQVSQNTSTPGQIDMDNPAPSTAAEPMIASSSNEEVNRQEPGSTVSNASNAVSSTSENLQNLDESSNVKEPDVTPLNVPSSDQQDIAESTPVDNAESDAQDDVVEALPPVVTPAPVPAESEE